MKLFAESAVGTFENGIYVLNGQYVSDTLEQALGWLLLKAKATHPLVPSWSVNMEEVSQELLDKLK